MHFPEERGRPAPDPAETERQRKRQQRRVQLMTMPERQLIRLYVRLCREIGRTPVDEPDTPRGIRVAAIMVIEDDLAARGES